MFEENNKLTSKEKAQKIFYFLFPYVFNTEQFIFQGYPDFLKMVKSIEEKDFYICFGDDIKITLTHLMLASIDLTQWEILYNKKINIFAVVNNESPYDFLMKLENKRKSFMGSPVHKSFMDKWVLENALENAKLINNKKKHCI